MSEPGGEALPGGLSSWQASGSSLLADGTRVFFQQRGRGPALLLLHGFPTSSYDWHAILPTLARSHRVIAPDLPGYGFSAKPASRNYSLLRQADAVEDLLAQLGVEQYRLVSHDMGNSVACELLARQEQKAARQQMLCWLMLNGGIYMDLHRPLPTQRLLRTPFVGPLTARCSSRWLFDRQYPRVYANPGQFDTAHYDEQWALITRDGGRRVLARLAGYMRERVQRESRWLGALHRSSLPLHLVWGRQDPIAVAAIAERLLGNRPGTTITWLDHIGHYPQLESPAAVVTEIQQLIR